jgi:hypothetical protein
MNLDDIPNKFAELTAKYNNQCNELNQAQKMLNEAILNNTNSKRNFIL